MESRRACARKRTFAGVGLAVALLLLCEVVSLAVLFSRMVGYTEAKFVHVMPLIEESAVAADPATSVDSSAEDTQIAVVSDGQTTSAEQTSSAGQNTIAHPEFRMEAEAEIFKLSYDNESGKTTVIGVEGSADKLIAPGTTNLYEFTLSNPGDVPLDYTLTMEAYIEGTDLYLPVNARVWDYTNKYLAGNQEEMVDVLALNAVEESAELGAGRYAVYRLEWEWPFERTDENGDITLNDAHDTTLGDLAVEGDITLTIVIRTIASYDEDPDDPDTGLPPPQTGDDAQLTGLILLCVGSLLGMGVLLFVAFKALRREKRAEQHE